MATRHFPPSPPILSHLHHTPFQSNILSQPSFPPTSTSPSVPRSYHHAVPPTAQETQPTSIPFPWSPSNQLDQTGQSGAIGVSMSPLALASTRALRTAGTSGRENLGSFSSCPLPGLMSNTMHASPEGWSGMQAVAQPEPGQEGMPAPRSDFSTAAEVTQRPRLYNLSSGLSPSGHPPLGSSPIIPSMVELRHGHGHGQRHTHGEEVYSYVLSPATTEVVRPPGQVGQVAPMVGNARMGMIRGIQDGNPIEKSKGEKTQDKVMEIHKSYQELLDRLHEDFVKERRIWVEERKLYEVKVRDLEEKVKTLESIVPSPGSKSEKFLGQTVGPEGYVYELETDGQERRAKWEPPPMSHPPGSGHSLESSSWAQLPDPQHQSQVQLLPNPQQMPYFSSFPPFSTQTTIHSHPPTVNSYSQPYQENGPLDNHSYPRPPTRDEISRPSEKEEKEKEKRSSSRVSFTSPTITQTHVDPLASPESHEPSSESVGEGEQDKSKGRKIESEEREHPSPIPSPELKREITPPIHPAPAAQSSDDDCDPEPILKSPSSKAIDILSPIPIHKIDPLHISPSPVPAYAITPSSSSPTEDYRKKEDIRTWRARSKSPGGLSEGGRSDASEPEIKLMLKKNKNFGDFGGWSGLKRVHLPLNMENNQHEFGFGNAEGTGGTGWKTPSGGFMEY